MIDQFIENVRNSLKQELPNDVHVYVDSQCPSCFGVRGVLNSHTCDVEWGKYKDKDVGFVVRYMVANYKLNQEFASWSNHDMMEIAIESEPSIIVDGIYRENGVLKKVPTRVETQEAFEQVKAQHLYNLEQIRKFILGDEYNQPQVTYVPEIAKFDSKITDIREWIESSYHNNEE